MKTTESARFNVHPRYAWAVVLMVVLAAACSYTGPAGSVDADEALLGGRVTSSDGEALAGIPVRAHRESSNITVAVYTNGQGEYSFPGWSDLSAGSHSVAIELADFEPVRREGIMLSAGQSERLDFSLQPREPSVMDATATDIVMALPGTEEQKFMLIQCDNCHSMQWVLKDPHTREEWLAIVRRMFGESRGSRNTPGTRAVRQKQYIEPLTDYLTSIRGPGSSDQIPFNLRPRPTHDAVARLVVTEYDIPRGGIWEPYIMRGDRRFAWPHDIIMDENYAYYTDHYTDILGRLDKKTGEVKEFPFSAPPEMEREENIPPGQINATPTREPRRGTHDILFDPQGRAVFGRRDLSIRFDPSTEQFTYWPSGGGMFGLDPEGNVWHVIDEGSLFKVDTTTGEVKEYKVPAVDGIYDHEVDSQARSIINVWGNGLLRVFDPRTEEYTDYPTPSPQSGPRRGDMDAQDRQWLGLYWAGRLAVFDPNQGEVREFPVIPGTEPFGAPFPMPYSAAVDEKNQIVWTSDFNSSRIYRFVMNTEKITEFFMPHPYEVRDLTVDEFADRPTVWIPDYRPPSKMVKVQLR